MAKFSGKIGFSSATETSPGVWQDIVTERPYKGDILRVSRRDQSSGNVNPNLILSHTLSIIADAFADQNFFSIKYINWKGGLWTVTGVEIQRPRLVLTIGGVYNGN